MCRSSNISMPKRRLCTKFNNFCELKKKVFGIYMSVNDFYFYWYDTVDNPVAPHFHRAISEFFIDALRFVWANTPWKSNKATYVPSCFPQIFITGPPSPSALFPLRFAKVFWHMQSEPAIQKPLGNVIIPVFNFLHPQKQRSYEKPSISKKDDLLRPRLSDANHAKFGQ